MTSSNPAELVLLVTGYRVSQAIHVAALRSNTQDLDYADAIMIRAEPLDEKSIRNIVHVYVIFNLHNHKTVR